MAVHAGDRCHPEHADYRHPADGRLEGYAQALSVPTGGTISGENIKLTIDGQLRNTGQVIASDTLTVKAESIDLSPNVVSIGTNAYKAQGGWNVVTGTVVQPGGFLSAMHMDIDADSIRAINDAFRITRADGSVDTEASAARVAQLKESLGLNYTEGTVADDIHTRFIKEKKGFGIIGQIVAMASAVAVAVSIVTAGAAAAAMGVALTSMSLEQAMVVAALSSMAGSLTSQVVSGQGVNFGKIAQAGPIGAVTAGLTNGIPFDGSNFGMSEWGQSLKGTNTLANLAGSNSAGGVLQAEKDGATGTIYQQAIGMVGTGLINAGVSTAFNGGSFGQAFVNNLVAQAAALGAKEIGASADELSLRNVASHAALGCAAQSAMGGDCAGGAIGGATSAVVAPLVRDGLYDGTQKVETTFNADGTVTTTTSYTNPTYNAVTAVISMLSGSAAAALLGRDANSAALAAQNGAVNNSLSVKIVLRPVPTLFGVVMMPMPVVSDDPIGTPNNGPQKSDPLTNPLEEQNNNGNAIATPNNGPQGSTLTGTPAGLFEGPTILNNPGCGSAGVLSCAAITVLASVKDGIDKLGGVLSGSQSSDASNVATYGPLKDTYIAENLANIAARDPRLAAAVAGGTTGNKNFSISTGTSSDADQLGKIWVGDGATRTSDGIGWISTDGSRVYRPPVAKSSPFASTGTQANFESYVVNQTTGQRTKISNGHLNVTE